MCGLFEGGRFLNVKWDRKRYRSNEEGTADIRVAGRYAPGEIRLTGTTEHDGETKELSIDPLRGNGDTFRTKVFFPERGEYAFKLEAMLGDELLEKYERTIRVGSAVNEGADLKVDRPFLESLASRSGGYYEGENEVDKLIERLEWKVRESASPQDLPLTRKPDILFDTLPVYILLTMFVLAGEWIVRRRMNML